MVAGLALKQPVVRSPVRRSAFDAAVLPSFLGVRCIDPVHTMVEDARYYSSPRVAW